MSNLNINHIIIFPEGKGYYNQGKGNSSTIYIYILDVCAMYPLNGRESLKTSGRSRSLFSLQEIPGINPLCKDKDLD
tara:strand:+ start:160 stop:390 length:231 start_codon:yes stop_codon:yes gene_type:complete